VDILVAGGFDDGSKTLLRNTHECVRVRSGFHSVNGNTDTSISAILKADRERDTRGELTVELGFGGTGTNGTPRNEISNVLRRNRVEKLRSDGNAEVGEVAQELTRKTQTLVDLEGTIKVRVVDKTFPSNGSAWFL